MSLAGKRVLVTGAEGFIGSHLTEALVAAGADVTALALYNSFGGAGWLDRLPAATRAGIRVVGGDIRDGAFMRRLTKDQSVVFHLAALIAIPHSYAAPQSYIDTNITGTVNVLEAAREAGVDRVVHTSTSEVYGTAQFTPITEAHPLQGQSPYSASKIGADMIVESFARSFGMPAYILRPFNTYGPRQSERAVIPTVIRQALDPECPAIAVGDVSTVRDFNYVADTVDAFLAMGEAAGVLPGIAYNAGSGASVTVDEMIGIVRKLTGTNKPVRQEESRMRPANSEVRALIASADSLAAATGWKSRTSLRDGLSLTVDWWREQVTAGAIRTDSAYLT